MERGLGGMECPMAIILLLCMFLNLEAAVLTGLAVLALHTEDATASHFAIAIYMCMHKILAHKQSYGQQ